MHRATSTYLNTSQTFTHLRRQFLCSLATKFSFILEVRQRTFKTFLSDNAAEDVIWCETKKHCPTFECRPVSSFLRRVSREIPNFKITELCEFSHSSTRTHAVTERFNFTVAKCWKGSITSRKIAFPMHRPILVFQATCPTEIYLLST